MYSVPFVRRDKAPIFSGSNSHPATLAPAGSNRSGSGGNDTAEASDGKGCSGSPASRQAVTYVNAEQASKKYDVGADPARGWGRPLSQAPGEQPDPACGPQWFVAATVFVSGTRGAWHW